MPRPRPPPATTPRNAPPLQRPALSQADMEDFSRRMQEDYDWATPPHAFQLAAIQAQLEGIDMIVQAPTGSGKTAIAAGPYLSPWAQGKTTIVVSPLLALQNEMVETFANEFKLQAVAVNSQNGALSPLLIKDILKGRYQIILISPEMLQSRTFKNAILRNTQFMRRVLSMVVDEAHCISHWGSDFRKKYGSLGVVRAFLPRGTPVVAVSATLTARVRRDIHSVLHFPKEGSKYLNEGNDRHNVSIVVRACEHPMNSYADLDFVLPATIKHHTDIPKTYIYVDDISMGSEIIDHLNAVLAKRTAASNVGTHPVPGIIRPFNATLSQDYRRAAMEQFRSGNIRVMVCTDAAGMGCNISDIDVVVQWKLPKTLSQFIQRAGRAARGRGRTGLAVLLVEPSAYNQNQGEPRIRHARPSTQTQQTQSQVAKQPRKTRAQTLEAKEYALAHGLARGGSAKADQRPAGKQPELDFEAADEGLKTFVQSVQCRRQVWAEAFDSPRDPAKNSA